MRLGIAAVRIDDHQLAASGLRDRLGEFGPGRERGAGGQAERAGEIAVFDRAPHRLDRQHHGRHVRGQARQHPVEIALHDERVGAERQMRPVLFRGGEREDRDAGRHVGVVKVPGGEVAPEAGRQHSRWHPGFRLSVASVDRERDVPAAGPAIGVAASAPSTDMTTALRRSGRGRRLGTACLDVARLLRLDAVHLGCGTEFGEALIVGVGRLDLLAIVDPRLRMGGDDAEQHERGGSEQARYSCDQCLILSTPRRSCGSRPRRSWRRSPRSRRR